MTEPFDAVLAKPPIPDTYSHTEVTLRNDKDTKWVRREDFDWHMKQQAARLAAAHAAEVAERDARLNGEKFAHEQTKRALAEATETWTDEAGNAWRPATAWAYAQSCRVRDEMRQRAEAAERDARRWQFARRRLKLQHQRTLAGGMRPAMDIRPAWSVLRGGDPGAGYLEPTRFEKECDELDAAVDAAIATPERAGRE